MHHLTTYPARPLPNLERKENSPLLRLPQKSRELTLDLGGSLMSVKKGYFTNIQYLWVSLSSNSVLCSVTSGLFGPDSCLIRKEVSRCSRRRVEIRASLGKLSSTSLAY
jgi:hypothetical protein